MERVAYDLAGEWRRRGHEVTYVSTPLPKGSQPADFMHLPGRSGRYTRSWARRVGRLSLEGVDVVFSVSSAGRRLVGNKAGVPVVMQAHGTSLGEIQTKLRMRSLRALVRLPKKFLWLVIDSLEYRKYTAVVGVGPAVTSMLHRGYPRFAQPRRYFEIRNGVRPSTSPETMPWERRQGVLFVGRLHAEKGLDILLRAVAGTDMFVTVCGDGPERRAAQDLAALLGITDRVHFLGELASEDVRSEVRRARVVAVPTRSNEVGPPLTILEALVEGTPVVSSPLLDGSLPHGFSDGFSIAADLSPEAFRDALLARVNQTAYDSQSLRDRSAVLTIGNSAGSYLELFDQLRMGETS